MAEDQEHEPNRFDGTRLSFTSNFRSRTESFDSKNCCCIYLTPALIIPRILKLSFLRFCFSQTSNRTVFTAPPSPACLTKKSRTDRARSTFVAYRTKCYETNRSPSIRGESTIIPVKGFFHCSSRPLSC